MRMFLVHTVNAVTPSSHLRAVYAPYSLLQACHITALLTDTNIRSPISLSGLRLSRLGNLDGFSTCGHTVACHHPIAYVSLMHLRLHIAFTCDGGNDDLV